jgi:selenide,water dikinase
METSDDAGVYRLSDELALVITADYITPPVDDPGLFGQIAAVNALNDVYAMGARPVACYNLVGFPAKQLGPEVLEGILAGSLAKIREAGAVLAGGHSTEDEEPKFGLAVNGLVHPDRIWRNSGAQAGDRLILTKPIGSGVLLNANLKRMVSPEAMERCLGWLATLNRTAAEVASRHPIHACTDVTGFGLAGHAFEMARGAGLTFRIRLDALPLMDEALEAYRRGVTTAVNPANREYVAAHTRFEAEVPAYQREIVYDPQTAGGLLFALSEAATESLREDLAANGITEARVIGDVLPLTGAHLVFE